MKAAGACRLGSSGAVAVAGLDDEGWTVLSATPHTILTCRIAKDKSPVAGRKAYGVEAVLGGGHRSICRDVAAHPRAPDRFATTGDDNSLIVWDLSERRSSTSLPNGGRSVAYDETGRFLRVGGADGAIRCFDSTSLEEIRTVEVFKTPVTSLKGGPGGVIAAGSRDGTVAILENDKVAAVFKDAHERRVEALDFGTFQGAPVLRSKAGTAVAHWKVSGRRSGKLRTRDATAVRWATCNAAPLAGGAVVGGAPGACAVADADGLELRSAPKAVSTAPGGADPVHSVTRIEVLAGGDRLVTLGRDDASVAIWSCRALAGAASPAMASPAMASPAMASLASPPPPPVLDDAPVTDDTDFSFAPPPPDDHARLRAAARAADWPF